MLQLFGYLKGEIKVNPRKPTSGKCSARDCFVTFIKLGWQNPGVSARYPPSDSGSKETFLVVCFPLPLLVDTSPTRCSSNHLLSRI